MTYLEQIEPHIVDQSVFEDYFTSVFRCKDFAINEIGDVIIAENPTAFSYPPVIEGIARQIVKSANVLNIKNYILYFTDIYMRMIDGQLYHFLGWHLLTHDKIKERKFHY